YTRANWAIQAGADLVLELPTIYSLSSAKNFAEGALKTLSMLGEFTLSFGTEADELQDLSMAAEFMKSESHDLQTHLKGFLSEGFSVAKSRTMALDRVRPDISNMLQAPNNILAVEYMKAGSLYGKNVQYHSVIRTADDNKKIVSSTTIRQKLQNGEDVAKFVPPYVDLSTRIDTAKYDTISAYSLKTKTAEELSALANISEGMENRISKSDFFNMQEFLNLTSKRYTRSTIKRIAASATVGVTRELVELGRNEKPYCTVLAVKNSKKKALFSLLANSCGYFFFKPSDCQKGHPIKPLIDLDEKACKIQQLCKF
ncbi:MAG: nucleotidyltransferase family protein, partial [Clostridia bacterium]